MSAHVFCRDVCLAQAEPLAGTGKMSARHLLVAWPRGKWRVPRFESVGMSPELGEAIRLAMKTGAHVALVDRVGETQTIAHLQADGVSANFETEAGLTQAIIDWTEGKPLVGQADQRMVVLCCTDSRRDACCARYGFATYKGLVASADAAKINVLQSTHVGGCRFAASLMVLPQRQRYGRLGPEDVGAFLAAIEAGQIYLPGFRGRSALAEAEQVAELAALQWAAKHGFGQSEVEVEPAPPAVEAADGDRIEVEASVAQTRLTVRLKRDTLPVHGRCSSLDEPAVPTPRWLLEAVEARA